MDGLYLTCAGVLTMILLTSLLRRHRCPACEEACEALIHGLPAPFLPIDALDPDDQAQALDRVVERLQKSGRPDLLPLVEARRLSLGRQPAPAR